MITENSISQYRGSILTKNKLLLNKELKGFKIASINYAKIQQNKYIEQ